MTTILADWNKGLIVTDSNCTDDDRVWSIRKVHRYKGVLYGFSGELLEAEAFLAWLKAGKKAKPPAFSNSYCLAMTPTGLDVYVQKATPSRIVGGIEAIGSGAKAVMCTYEALGYSDPKKAVSIVCKHDCSSRGPVRVYHMPR